MYKGDYVHNKSHWDQSAMVFLHLFFLSHSSLSCSLSASMAPTHGVPVRGPGNNGLRMRLIKTAHYA